MNSFTLDPRLDRDSIFVRDLKLSQLRLQNNANVLWLILVPKRADVREIFELSAQDRQLLMDEICQASEFLQRKFSPHKINVAALGNQVPQLHVHIIARRTDDPAWPNPIWGKIPDTPYPSEKLSSFLKIFNDIK